MRERGWHEAVPGQRRRARALLLLALAGQVRPFPPLRPACPRRATGTWPSSCRRSDYLDDAAGWGFALTPVEYRVRDRAARLARAEAMIARPGCKPLAKRSDEAMLDQFAALMGGRSTMSRT
jgi:hypothetical protein